VYLDSETRARTRRLTAPAGSVSSSPCSSGLASQRKIGPCKVLKEINHDAYKVELPSHLRTSHVFNVKHLVPYHDLKIRLNSRKSFFFQPGGNDVVRCSYVQYHCFFSILIFSFFQSAD
jgi:hypothetical protein